MHLDASSRFLETKSIQCITNSDSAYTMTILKIQQDQRGYHRDAELARNYYGLSQKHSIFSAMTNGNSVLALPLEKREHIPLHKIIRNELYYKPLGVGCVMMMIQQLTGIRLGLVEIINVTWSM